MNGTTRTIGRLATRLAAAWVVALVILGAMLGAAGAETKTSDLGNKTKTQFIKGCFKAGGEVTTLEAPGNGFTCTHNDGKTETCDWTTKQCTTTTPFRQPNRGPHAPLGDAVLTQDEDAPPGPGTRVGDVRANGGTVLVATDDDDQP
jgi:hypothetical protein